MPNAASCRFLKAVDRRGAVSPTPPISATAGWPGISTGLVDLDKKLGGLHPSDLLILAGRPSMGKTSLATNIAFNIAKAYKRGRLPDGSEGAVEGGVVGFFSASRCRPNNSPRGSCPRPPKCPPNRSAAAT